MENNFPDIISLSSRTKNKFVEDVIESYRNLMACRTFENLYEYIGDAFLYKNIMNDGSIIDLKLNSKYTFYWKVSKPQHEYLSKINKEGKILTWDSIHATRKNKAGISGLIEGKYLTQLEDFIRDKYPNIFSMTSMKLISDTKDYKSLERLVEKYNHKGPFYDINTDYDGEKWIINPGYREFYAGIRSIVRQVDEFVDNMFPEDKKLDSYLNLESTKTKKIIAKDFRLRDLYVLSFLGNNMNDNSLFKVLSEFRPHD